MDEKTQQQIERAKLLVEEALAIEAESAKDAGAIGYVARVLAQATMPHSRPETNEFERSNGAFRIHMMAPASVGLPFGTYPRLLMTWIVTEATRTKNPKLWLGDNLSAFMRELGLVPHGGRWGTITRLREQLDRLTRTTIDWMATATVDGAHGELGMGIRPIEERRIWWDPKRPDQADLWESTLTLNQRFYEAAINRPVPVDLRALKALAHERSPLALDIYTWLTYRMSYLEEPVTIPWAALELQFGGDYADTRVFKFKFLERLKLVKALYPAARVRASEDRRSPGLILEPSPTHVPKLVRPKLKVLAP
jgi:hypothetical protein